MIMLFSSLFMVVNHYLYLVKTKSVFTKSMTRSFPGIMKIQNTLKTKVKDNNLQTKGEDNEIEYIIVLNQLIKQKKI